MGRLTVENRANMWYNSQCKQKIIIKQKRVGSRLLFFCINYESIYVYNEEYGVVKIRYTQEMLGNLKQLPSTAIDVTAVGDYLLENHLGRAMGEEPTYVKEVIFMGNPIKVICLNGALLLDDINKEDQKKAAASFAELEAYRKKVSKKLSRSALSELKKLSPKQVLNLQFLL